MDASRGVNSRPTPAALAPLPFFGKDTSLPIEMFVKIFLEFVPFDEVPCARLVCRRWAQVLGAESFRRSFLVRYFPNSLERHPPKNAAEVVKLQMEQLRITRHVANNYYIKTAAGSGMHSEAACFEGGTVCLWDRDEVGNQALVNLLKVENTHFSAIHFGEECIYGANSECLFFRSCSTINFIAYQNAEHISILRGLGDWVYFTLKDGLHAHASHKKEGVSAKQYGSGLAKITCLEVTPQLLLLGCEDGYVEVVDRSSGKLMHRLCHQTEKREFGRTNGVSCVQYTQGKLYAGGSAGFLSIWEPKSGVMLDKFKLDYWGILSLSVYDCWLFYGTSDGHNEIGGSLRCLNLATKKAYKIYDTTNESPHPKTHFSVHFVHYQAGKLIAIFGHNDCFVFDYTPEKKQVFKHLKELEVFEAVQAQCLGSEDFKSLQLAKKTRKKEHPKEGCLIA